ncbi:hypothetical protein LAZ67_X002362 [Cordylochernes scorpioides]|uniref:Mos1 transposase HTH domain-containing protein n=1 Tax=Cordylochernes scorpioides TaxID=51811 RepID=A0ABY6LTB1_9ARAC|nr:hypothetical protein LAZ67_X002362 [Cordylochernes scorpioides]
MEGLCFEQSESLIKNLLTENADIPEAIDENQEDSSILETTFVIEDEESNKDIGTPKIEISEVSVIDKSEGKYSKEPVVSVEALDKKELCHDDPAHLNVVEADLNRAKEATSGIINVYTEANESSSKEKVVPVEIVDTSTKDYLQSGEKAKLSRWKPIDSLCLEDVKESEDDDENYSSSAYIEWPEILKKEVLRPEALEKAVNLEDFEKAAESRQLSKEHFEESTEQGSCIKAESKTWEDPIESDLAAAESDNPAVPERELANESENLIQDSPQSDTQRWKLIQKLKNSFSSRWSKEYLSNLQGRDNMLTKYQMIKLVDFCEVWFLPESIQRVSRPGKQFNLAIDREPLDNACHVWSLIILLKYGCGLALKLRVICPLPRLYGIRLRISFPIAVWQPFAMEPLSSPAKCELRSVIRFLNAKNNSPVEIYRQLVEVYGEKCMDIKNVRKWCREFNEGRINVHDEQRSGRPSLPESTMARINEMVCANRRITLEEIKDGLNEDCSHFSVHKIVSETLGYRKVSARWVDKWLKEAAGEWYNTGITKLVDRMKKVIENQGDYVEK